MSNELETSGRRSSNCPFLSRYKAIYDILYSSGEIVNFQPLYSGLHNRYVLANWCAIVEIQNNR
jgi:hypothetical protein